MIALGSTPREPRQSWLGISYRPWQLFSLSRFGSKAGQTRTSMRWSRPLDCACGIIACGVILFVFLLLAICFALPATLMAQNVSIGTATANNSALLHLESTSKGFLLPRVTNTQMQSISTPATSDIIWNTTYTNYYYYTGSYWTPLAGSGWALTGDASTSASTNFLGTKDSVDVVQKTNAYERLRFFAGANVGLTNTLNSAEELRFYVPSGSGSYYTALKAPVLSSNVRYTLPPADGSPNAALYDSMGTLGWHVFASVGGSGSQSLWIRGNGQAALMEDSSSDRAGGADAITAGYNNTASGKQAAIFGNNNSSSGQQPVVTGGTGNSSSSDNTVIRGGKNNNTSGNNTYIGGGLFNQVAGSHGTIVQGDSNSVSGGESVIIDGAHNSVSSLDNIVFGSNVNTSGANNVIFYPSSATKLGIGTSSPAQAGDIVGNMKFSNALKPNGSGGTNGLYLLSAGSGSPPTWGTMSLAGNTFWGLSGNMGSNSSTNFIGTTDSVTFVLRTNFTERLRVNASGQVGVNTTSSTHQLQSYYSGTTDETAAIYGASTGSTSNQAVGVWGRSSTSSTSNTGTIGVLATGNGNSTGGQVNAAVQISQGKFAMGRTTESPSVGTAVEAATSGTNYSAQGPSGVIQLSLTNDCNDTLPPIQWLFYDLGSVTINNRYIDSNSIILASVVSKIDGGGNPSPKNSMYRLDIESRTAGSAVMRVGMVPFVTDIHKFQGSDAIRIGYYVLNRSK